MENLKLKFSRLDSKRSRISSTEDKEKPARKRRSFSVNHGIDRFVTGRSKGVGQELSCFVSLKLVQEICCPYLMSQFYALKVLTLIHMFINQV